MEQFYRTTYARALHSAVVNGFWQRYLDADDLEFLEYVRKSGSANSSLPGVGAVLLEELEFWHLPYSIAPGVERRSGPRIRISESAEKKQARRAAWQARRIIREQERAIADAELERERQEWEKARKMRAWRALIADTEWEAAAPHKAHFGATVGRHHVPQWKLDERGVKAAVKEIKPLQEKLENAEPGIDPMTAMREAIEEDRQRREKIIEQARKTIEDVEKLKPIWEQATHDRLYPNADSLKNAIMRLITGTGINWSPGAIAAQLGCIPEEARVCLEALVQSGRLQRYRNAADRIRK
jgi:hypothetical protein